MAGRGAVGGRAQGGGGVVASDEQRVSHPTSVAEGSDARQSLLFSLSGFGRSDFAAIPLLRAVRSGRMSVFARWILSNLCAVSGEYLKSYGKLGIPVPTGRSGRSHRRSRQDRT
nr:hypothetical protein GCM10025732_18770 [Glycomyces mayteni]